MNPYYELPNLGRSFQQAHADRAKRPDRQIGGITSIVALWLVNVLESAALRTVGGISRWRRRRTAIRELQALSDYYLTDIGLDRSQIVATVEKNIETGSQPAWCHARFWCGDGIGPDSREIHGESLGSTEEKPA